MKKRIELNKFVTDLWGTTHMLVEKAVLAEREACAAILDANAMACENPSWRSLLQANAQEVRARGEKA
jgi:hypothetical protein